MQPAGSYQCVETPDAVSVAFSATFANVDRACKDIARFLTLQISGIEKHLFWINLGLREGLTNAVRHGNLLDPAKLVRCYVSIESGTTLVMEIEDQGDGFDWRSAGELPVDDSAEHGRGLVILRQYFSEVSYNEIGNRLRLKKILPV